MKSGIGLLILAMALTPLTDGLSKTLTLAQTTFFIVFARYFCAGLVALLVAVLLRRPLVLPRQDHFGQVWRTALMMGAMVAMISALSMVDLAKAVGGFLIAPVVASLVSVVLYRERMDSARAVGAILSFMGAYIILRPEGSLEMGTFLALSGGVMLGFYLAATRHARDSGDAFSTLIVQCLLGAMLVVPLAFLHGLPSLGWGGMGIVLALGVISAACHYLTIAAYSRTDASVLAPFFYFNIVFAIPVGYLWFHEIPTAATLLGLGGITLGGIVAMLSGSRYVFVFTGILALPRIYACKWLLKT